MFSIVNLKHESPKTFNLIGNALLCAIPQQLTENEKDSDNGENSASGRDSSS